MHMMELLGDMGHIKSCFGQFGDGISIGARWGHGFYAKGTLGLEIVLDEADGTPR
jgi:hypothetical protein